MGGKRERLRGSGIAVLPRCSSKAEERGDGTQGRVEETPPLYAYAGCNQYRDYELSIKKNLAMGV